jgi:hypothetical protein
MIGSGKKKNVADFITGVRVTNQWNCLNHAVSDCIRVMPECIPGNVLLSYFAPRKAIPVRRRCKYRCVFPFIA